jgi:cytochrome P450
MLFSDPRVTADARVYERYTPPADPRARQWLTRTPFRSSSSGSQSLGRRLVVAALTPRAVERMRSRVEEVVAEFAAPLDGRTGTVDLMEEFTAPISATTIGRILGLPPNREDETRFRRLAVNATATIQPFLSEKKRQRTEQAAAEMCEYVLALVEERRELLREDLISDLLRASQSDSQETLADITGVVSGLVSAGTGTTSVACARALRTLLTHPHQLELLRSDRSLLPNAIEELLRYDSGLLVMPRYVAQNFELHGRSLERGQLVVLSMLSANRDPRVFVDPDVVDIRRDAREALSFGHGTHYCVGANIARMELIAMIDAALDFLPRAARLAEKEIRWSHKGLMSQIQTLPVDFDPPAPVP